MGRRRGAAVELRGLNAFETTQRSWPRDGRFRQNSRMASLFGFGRSALVLGPLALAALASDASAATSSHASHAQAAHAPHPRAAKATPEVKHVEAPSPQARFKAWLRAHLPEGASLVD